MAKRLIAELHVLLVGSALTILVTVATASASSSPRVTRADLGLALLQLEQAMADHELDGQMIRSVNRRFDAAVSYFFTRRYSEAIKLINNITRELLPMDQRSSAYDWLMSVTVDIEPRTYEVRNEQHPTVTIRSLYDPPPFPNEQPSVEFRLIDADEAAVWSTTLDLSEDIGDGPINARLMLDKSLNDLSIGAYEIEIEIAGIEVTVMRFGRIFVLPRPVDDLRRELLKAINEIKDDDGTLARAIRIARARTALLKQRPSPLNSTEFLADLHQLHQAVRREVESLRHGRDPYRMHEGDLWRPAATREATWPMRVYAPADLKPDEPLPLVIALHGAGGDENMFHDAYGNGRLRRLAKEHRFVVASPLTYPLGGDMNLLSELIDEMQRCYPIDEGRVYLIGHSLGAGTVSAALLAMPDRIAAASCIAGAGRFAIEGGEGPYPPVLVIGAEHDFVVPPARLRQQAEAGMDRDLPIEYRLAKNWGHVLVVGGVLDDVIPWLLRHERSVINGVEGGHAGD